MYMDMGDDKIIPSNVSSPPECTVRAISKPLMFPRKFILCFLGVLLFAPVWSIGDRTDGIGITEKYAWEIKNFASLSSRLSSAGFAAILIFHS